MGETSIIEARVSRESRIGGKKGSSGGRVQLHDVPLIMQQHGS